METDMRLLALMAVGLLAGSLLIGCGPAPAMTSPDTGDKKDDKKVKDEEAILGKWQMEKVDNGSPDDKPPPAETLAKMSMTFKKGGKMVTVVADGREIEGEYTLDTTAKLKTIDLTDSDSGAKTASPGVYELDGDKLTICVNPAKTTRPSEFKADGKFVLLFVLKRVKDGGK
jgi:uncharacterized protein (TIGR03067 family)